MVPNLAPGLCVSGKGSLVPESHQVFTGLQIRQGLGAGLSFKVTSTTDSFIISLTQEKQ